MEDWDFSGDQLIAQESESIIERLSILTRTREATQSEPGRGCILSQALTKQIQERRSQLDSLIAPSREVSVIRCTSTPENQLSVENLSFGNLEACQHKPKPFQIYLDNPSDFYRITAAEPPAVSIVSTVSSDLPVFDMDDEETPEAAAAADARAAQEAAEKVEKEKMIKNTFLEKFTRMLSLMALYDPENYDADILAHREAQWLGEVKEAVIDINNQAMAKAFEDAENTSVYEKVVADTNKDCQKFIVKYQRKIMTLQASGHSQNYVASSSPAQFSNNASGSSHGSAASAIAAEKLKAAQCEVDIDAEIVTDDVKSLAAELAKVDDWTKAESHIVEKYMQKIEPWKKQLRFLKNKVRSIKKNTVMFDLNNTKQLRAESAVNSLEAELEIAIEHLEHEDSERCLYSLNKSNTASIKYPQFSGHQDEDYIKFMKEIKNCFRVNRVRLDDQVPRLRENLRGAALGLVPVTMNNIDECFKVLSTVYGDPSRVMNSRKNKINSMGPFIKLATNKTAAGVKAQVQWLISLEICLQDIFDLAETSTDMDREAFNQTTFNSIMKLFPLECHVKMAEETGDIKEQTAALFNYVVEKKETLQKSLKTLEHATVGVTNDKFSKSGSNASNNDKNVRKDLFPNASVAFKPPTRYEKCRICVTLDAEGVTEGLYDAHTSDLASGCPVFAGMDTNTRKKYVNKAQICPYCLDADFVFKPGKRHPNCIAFKGNKFFTCRNSNCKRHFLICTDHIQENKEIHDRCNRFWNEKGKQFSFTISISSLATASASKSSSGASNASKSVPVTTTAAPKPIVAALKANSNTASEMLRKMAGPNTIVNDPPAGDPLFLFSYIHGKTRPVTIFYDDGCSHAMFKEGIPIGELDAVMTRRGPLQISAAGNSTVTVNHEWAVMLDKTDNSKQIIVGVSADELTSKFPMISTAAAHKDIVDHAPEEKRDWLSRLRVPAQAGGQPDILLGIKYKSLHPRIVHQLPSGLFIAKLQLKSHDKKSNAVIGGPHESFRAMMHQCGDNATLMSCFIASLEKFRKYGPPSIAGPIMTQEDLDFAASFNHAEVHGIVGDDNHDAEESVADSSDIDDAVHDSFGFTIQCSGCGDDVAENPSELLHDIRLDLGDEVVGGNGLRFSLLANTSAASGKDDRLRLISSAGFGNGPRFSLPASTSVAATFVDSDDKLNDLKTLIKIQEQGINLEYRCPKCRNCWSCKNASDTERLSLREELEDDAIRESVKIDFANRKIVAVMPFRGDPAQYLSDNRHIAEKVLESQCRKVKNDEEAKATVIKSFKKLTDNNYAIEFSKLSEEQQANILSKTPQHYLPWRVVYKESVSTPCRTVLDGSSKTPVLEDGRGGRCLNDITMKGRINTLNLISMLLRFSVGPKAFCGDLKQFYNRIGLTEDQWHLQRVLYKENMDINGETKELVIVTLIYGVKPVSALSERAVLDLAESISKVNPRLEELLVIARYCDDLADSDKDDEAVLKIIADADKLFSSVGLECKGWSKSNEDPHKDVTHDGVSVDVGGVSWYPKIDSIVVKIPPLHFGIKSRGKLKVGTEIFQGTMADLDKFVPKKLSKRMVTSKFSSLFDPYGKLLPETSVMKCHLRKVCVETEGWDDAMPDETRKLWVKNLFRLHSLQGIHFQRAIVPEDAVDLNLQLVAAVDAADVKVAGVWGRFKKKNGEYSCQLIIGRSLLSRVDSTIPKEELESLTIGSNLLWITRKALESWSHDYVLLGDSAISICWVTNTNKRLSIFHRNRCNQIRMNTDVDKIYWVKTNCNPSDICTRPDKVKVGDVGPDSYWERGLPWMTQSLESAVAQGIIKPSGDLRLNPVDEDEHDKGYILEKDIEILVKGHCVDVNHSKNVENMTERATFSKYLFIPKFNFKKVVAITSLVYKFISLLKYKKFKDIRSKAKLLPVSVVSEFAGLSWTSDKVAAPDNEGEHRSVTVRVSDIDVSRALVYWYSKATEEVKHFNKAEYVQRVGVEKEGILFCRSRIMDGQRFLQAGEFDDDDVGNDIGLNLMTPLVDRHSPIALSIALHIHHDVAKHAGFETCYRTSLQYCYILQGNSLFKELGEQCVKCHKVRRKYLEVVMSPVADHQVAMSPPFYTAFVDIDGPYETYVPGFERQTRNRKCLATKNYILTFCCPISKLVNLQVIESKNAQSVVEGLTRLGCEIGFPKFVVLDKETSFMRVVNDAEINLQDLQLRAFKEFGIQFKTAPVAAHNFTGLVERKIKTVQDLFLKIDLKNARLHSTGLQTFAKIVENHLNNLPLGFSFGTEATNTPMLQLLTPNMLRHGRLNSRALVGPVKLPRGPKEMMNKVETLYNAFYKIWNIVMIPRLIAQPKWFKSSQEIKIDDVVYFQKVDNNIASEWTVGQVDSIVRSKDGCIRKVTVRYCNSSEDVARFTERSVRSLVRLFHIEDDYFVRDMEMVEELVNAMEEDKDDRVQPLKLIKDKDGSYKIQDRVNVSSSCLCCCVGHCAMSHLTPTVSKSGVTLSHLVTKSPDLEFMYTKEIVTDVDTSIIPDHVADCPDDMLAVVTALETQFNLSYPDPCYQK